MERAQRISGLRAKAIEASLLMPIILASCGGDNTPATQKPTSTPNETPTPTIVLTPTPEVTPTPTIEPTPTPTIEPTPEETPVPIANLINQIIDKAGQDGWKKVSAQTVIDSINKAYENDPEAAAIINPATNTLEKEVITKIWKNCSTNEDPSAKVLSCAGLVGHLYYEGYSVGMNEDWLNTISNVINYAHGNLVKQDFNSFEAYATDQKSPF